LEVGRGRQWLDGKRYTAPCFFESCANFGGDRRSVSLHRSMNTYMIRYIDGLSLPCKSLFIFSV
jgi:hypothetical protein